VAEALAAGVPGEGGAIEKNVRHHDAHKQTLPKNINRPNCTEYRTRSTNTTAVVVLRWLVTLHNRGHQDTRGRLRFGVWHIRGRLRFGDI
jgi:hypothetical protein